MIVSKVGYYLSIALYMIMIQEMETLVWEKIFLWGIILNALRLLLDRFMDLPDLLSGGLLAISIAIMLIGIYSTSKERNKDIEVKKDSENI